MLQPLHLPLVLDIREMETPLDSWFIQYACVNCMSMRNLLGQIWPRKGLD